MFRRSPSQTLFALVLILAAGQAAAFCRPVPTYRFVGDTTSDAMCTDNDIQSAIDNQGCATTIVITREHLYTAQHLTINNKSLTLTAVGDGVPCGMPIAYCDPNAGPCNNPPPTAPLVTLDGTGQSGQSVISITGNSNVTLQYLEIKGGNLDSSHSGGGIFFGDAGSGGFGTLTLDTVTVDHNTAGLGGGIALIPGGGSSASTLTLKPNTLILENTALDSGGGIFVSGFASLLALAPQTLIALNHAPNGYGGGVDVVGPALAYIGSPGYNGGAALQFNDAQNGGGIAVFAKSPDVGGVSLFTTDRRNPVQVSNNIAANRGGAIYLKGSADFVHKSTVAYACIFDYRINNNIAADGAAIYADRDTDSFGDAQGSLLELNVDNPCRSTLNNLPAVTCATGIPCNQMYGNNALDSNNQPTGGRVIVVAGSSYFSASRLDLRYSEAGKIVTVAAGNNGSDGNILLSSCLIADNHVQQAIVEDQGNNDSEFLINGCTLANNTIDNGYVLYAAFGLEIADSIIDQPGVPTLNYSGLLVNLNASYLMLLDAATFPEGGPTIIPARPTFVDAAHGDYHLQATSYGIDFAPVGGGTDLDGNPRDVDLAAVPNQFGPRDLGAYERQSLCAADTIFCDGFEVYH